MDESGGSVDKVVVEVVGEERMTVRISPWSTFQGEE
jgi:hypothetical protein